MSFYTDQKRKGQRPFMVWIPEGLYQAVRDKLYRDKRTAQAVMNSLLAIWSGWEKENGNETESGNDQPPDNGI